MTNWREIQLDKILTESREVAKEQKTDKRLTVKLHLQGVHKREERATDNIGSTVYFKRKAGQFIYGKQNLHKGAIGVIPNELNGYQSTQDVPAFDVSEEVDINWLYYYFARPSFYKNLESLATGTGSKRIHPRELLKLDILVPPLVVQKKISEIISSVDKVIEKTEAIIEKTEKIKQGLMQQLLTKGIGHTRFKKTEIGELPEEWEITLLDNVANRYSGHTPNKKKDEYWNGLIPWISLKDTKRLDKGYIIETTDYTTLEGIENSSAVLLPKNTVVISRDATVGKIGIMMKEMATSQHFINYVCTEKLHYWYLYYYLIYNKATFERIATGSTIKTIGLQFFKNLKIALPPVSEQLAIAEMITSIDEKIGMERRKLLQVESLKNGLMQSLFTGKIHVKVDEVEVTQV
ncbi:restriction endonuclease subunit S [Bacillus cereus group sp. BY10-2LC]|uniref:restriction endonuclease subunit S n=1 Tax=Bacillus cereus group sp. BY10-2LC TaxID=3018089 RepID=UPI0022E1A933|nr:restriction endonuclease subunit S [Bacillus cereus group sp. BY10-2LC]MDA1879540.1 restriction endonuclease subunit S [Bacillus cereus group sp. BY10-2LC]